MPPWLDQLLVLVALGGALAYFWLGARRKRGATHGSNSAPPCAGGCCPPTLPPHLKPGRRNSRL